MNTSEKFPVCPHRLIHTPFVVPAQERAKLQASSDMTALLNLLPTVARLLPPNSPLDGNSGIKSEVRRNKGALDVSEEAR